MNAERVRLALDSYLAHLEASGESLCGDMLRAAEQCRTHFDLMAEDLSGMLRAAFGAAQPVINYASSVQPLNGLYHLAEQAPEKLRSALMELLAEDGDDLGTRQQQMQHFVDACNACLKELLPGKRSWEQNLRAAMAYVTFLHPKKCYLYKSTEARAFADMVGFGLDVAAGSSFRLENYHAMCDALLEVIRRHRPLTERLGGTGDALLHFVVYELIVNAPAGKWGLFGDLQPMVKTRSRAGQASQERSQRISRMQVEIALLRSRADALARQAEELPVPDMTGQHFHSAAFGRVEAIHQESGRLHILVNGEVKRMALPMSILQGFLTPEDEQLRIRYDQERALLVQKRTIETEIRNRETEMQRLQAKP